MMGFAVPGRSSVSVSGGAGFGEGAVHRSSAISVVLFVGLVRSFLSLFALVFVPALPGVDADASFLVETTPPTMTICSPSFTPERIWAFVTLLYTNLDLFAVSCATISDPTTNHARWPSTF